MEQVSGSVDSIKNTVEHEGKRKKLCIVIWAIIHFAISGIIVSFEFLRHKNVQDSQSDFETLCPTEPP